MKTDKRVRYTKMFLKEALIKLLNEKPISRVTIKELCEEAEINRATFYAHYQDQYDLLEQTEMELVNNLLEYLNSLSKDPNEDRISQITKEVLRNIDANKELVCVLWGKNGDMNFQEQMTQLFRDSFITLLENKNNRNTLENELIYSYTIHGCIGVMRKWLFEEYGKISIDELAELILRITNSNQLLAH